MRIRGKLAKVIETTVSITCDKCGKSVLPSDIVEWQELQSFDGCGGYGSCFGDSDRWTLDLCDSCWHGLVGHLVKYEEDDAD